MKTVMSESVPSRPLTALEQGGFGSGMDRSEYDKNAQIKGSIWSTISPAMLARKVFNKVRSQLAQVNQNQTFVYDDGPGMFYPGGNIVLAEMDRQNDKWETLSDPIYGGPRTGRKADKNLFERTLYEEMVGSLVQKVRNVRNARLMGTYTNLPHGPESIVASMLSGIEKKNAAQQGDILKERAGIAGPAPSRKGFNGGRTRRRRARKTRRGRK